jgi:hypothetical protein
LAVHARLRGGARCPTSAAVGTIARQVDAGCAGTATARLLS